MANSNSSDGDLLYSDLLPDIDELVNIVNECPLPTPNFSEEDVFNGTRNRSESAERFYDPVADYYLPFHKDPLLTPQPSHDEISHLRLRCAKLENCMDNLNQTLQSLQDEYEDQHILGIDRANDSQSQGRAKV